MEPLAVTSVRKLALVTALPDCALVWLTSDEFTAWLAVVSPTSTSIRADAGPNVLPDTSRALFRVTIKCWIFVTPVRFTVTWFTSGPIAGAEVVAVPCVVLAVPAAATLRSKVKTSW